MLDAKTTPLGVNIARDFTPEGAACASEALRSLIDAVMFYPEDGRGKYRLELRGDRMHPVNDAGLTFSGVVVL